LHFILNYVIFIRQVVALQWKTGIFSACPVCDLDS